MSVQQARQVFPRAGIDKLLVQQARQSASCGVFSVSRDAIIAPRRPAQRQPLLAVPHREQCVATQDIRREFGTKNALDYLISEKLFTFVEVAEKDSDFAAELPAFLAAIQRQFSTAEIRKYLHHLERTKFLAPFEPEVEDGEEAEPWPDNPVLGAQELLRFSSIQMLQA